MPDEIEVSVWIKRGKMFLRRDALNGDDPDHTYNHVKARGIRPEDYGIRRGAIDPAARTHHPIDDERAQFFHDLYRDEEAAP